MAAPLSLSCERTILVCDEQTHQHSGGSINPDSESKASSPGVTAKSLNGNNF